MSGKPKLTAAFPAKKSETTQSLHLSCTMPTSPISHPDTAAAQQLDELVPIIADVIHHANGLQKQAESAVNESRIAASETRQAAAILCQQATSLEARLAERVVPAVAAPFHEAVSDAAQKISEDLSATKKAARQAIVDMTAASSEAATAIREQAQALEGRLLMYGGLGVMFGFIIGFAVAFVALR